MLTPDAGAAVAERAVRAPQAFLAVAPRRERVVLPSRWTISLELLLKDCLDRALAAAGLVVLAPVFFALGLLIKFDSPGPAYFVQTRVGRTGRAFRMFKFRTMRQDAEVLIDRVRPLSIYGDPKLFKVPDDPRMTRLGRLLRRTSLDELPQLLNVVRGEMSLVGPRPPLPSEVALYEEHHRDRLNVLPGITGPWQVGGRNAITDFEEIVRMELEYIGGWSLTKDLRILVLTLPAVIRMDGAH